MPEDRANYGRLLDERDEPQAAAAEHELAVYAEAQLRTFAQPIDEHYWYRSRFKFQSITQQELDRMADPAAVISGHQRR